MVDNALLTSSAGSLTPEGCSQAPTPASRVLVPLITLYLYGMERAVIEAFDALRPEVEPYFVQSSRINGRNPPIIQEMRRRGFPIVLLPDKTDWEPPSRPRSIRHFLNMMVALVRSNITILRAARGKNILYVPGLRAGLFSVCAALMFRISGRRVVTTFMIWVQPCRAPVAGFRSSRIAFTIRSSATGLSARSSLKLGASAIL